MKNVLLFLAFLLLSSGLTTSHANDDVPGAVDSYLRKTLDFMLNSGDFPPRAFEDSGWWFEIYVGTAYRVLSIKEIPAEDPSTTKLRYFEATVEYDLLEVHHRKEKFRQDGCVIEPLNKKATFQYDIRYRIADKKIFWFSLEANPVFLPGKGTDWYCPTPATKASAPQAPLSRTPARKK